MATTLYEKTFAQLFTYSGGAGGTCVNAQGWIQPGAAPRRDFDPVTKAAKGLLIEGLRTNLLTYSSRFEMAAVWARNGLVSVVPEAAVSPSGRRDACKIVLGVGVNTISDSPSIIRSLSKAASAVRYTASVYLKPGGLSNAIFMVAGASTVDRVNFAVNLATRAVATTLFGAFTAAFAKVVDAGNGWLRIEGTVTSDVSAAIAMRIYPMAAAAAEIDGVNGVYAWGAQLEAGPFATSHIPSRETFTGRASLGSYYDAAGVLRIAAAGGARVSYEPSDLSLAPVLLLEGQSTNLLTESEFRNGVADAPTRANITAATEFGGGFTTCIAFPVVPSGQNYNYAVKNVALAASTTYVLSVFVRMDDGLAPALPGSDGGRDLALVIANQALPASACAVANVGGGIYRLSGVATTNSSPNASVGVYKYAANTARTFKVTGFQLEQAAFASSYIPTTTAQVTRVADSSTSAAVTRSADTVRIDASKGWCNLAEGTITMEFRLPQTPDTTTRSLVELGNTTIGNRMGLGVTVASAIYGYSSVNGAGGASTASVVPPGPTAKVSLSYGSDGLRAGCNGGAIRKAALAAIPPITHLGLGCLSSGSNQPCFHIRAANYYPQKMTDAEVIALTA